MNKRLVILGIVLIIFLFNFLVPIKNSFAYFPKNPFVYYNLLPGPGFISPKMINEAMLEKIFREMIALLIEIKSLLKEIENNLGKIEKNFPDDNKNIPREGKDLTEGPRQGNFEQPSSPKQEQSQPSTSNSSIKIAIIDIDPEHAEEVKRVMEERIRRENPNANVEIRTIILPGEWQADGSKAVATSAILDAFAQAKAWGARVINMSIGSTDGIGGPILNALRDLYESGILVVAASGNEGSYDAWAEAGRYVLSVGIRGAPYSNTADLYVDWGEIPEGLEGTSFAAPIIAAEAALALLENPSLTLADLVSRLNSRESMYAEIPSQRNYGGRVFQGKSSGFRGFSISSPELSFYGQGFPIFPFLW